MTPDNPTFDEWVQILTREINHFAPITQNPDQALWRYMDFYRYMSLLESSSLVFVSIERLRDPIEGDPFEGTFPQANNAAAAQRMEENSISHITNPIIEGFRRTQRQGHYVSCWHMNTDESVAMWKIYAQDHKGIAIRTTIERLRRCLRNQPCIFGAVQYIDFQSTEAPIEGIIRQLLAKRQQFDYEQELRVLLPSDPFDNNDLPEIQRIELNLSDLIEAVHVAPRTEEWIRDLIANINNRYGLDIPINQSTLDNQPHAFA